MDTPNNVVPHPTKSQIAAYYLLICIFLGIGIYILVQGISNFWQ
jgi:hypothetical protein